MTPNFLFRVRRIDANLFGQFAFEALAVNIALAGGGGFIERRNVSTDANASLGSQSYLSATPATLIRKNTHLTLGVRMTEQNVGELVA